VSRRRLSPEALEAAERFRAGVYRESCLFTQTRPGHKCEGWLERHHIIKKSWLWTNFSPRPDRDVLCYPEEIGVTLCRRAHELVTVHADYVYWHEVPDRAKEWAESQGITYRLERECPFLFAPGVTRHGAIGQSDD
jgi:hypothetical protein